jgi:hypothetical protein
MAFYVEITLSVYDDAEHTTGVGPFRDHAKAKQVADSLQERLTRGKAKAVLDERYGEGQYNVTVLPFRLRTPVQAYAELTKDED